MADPVSPTEGDDSGKGEPVDLLTRLQRSVDRARPNRPADRKANPDA